MKIDVDFFGFVIYHRSYTSTFPILKTLQDGTKRYINTTMTKDDFYCYLVLDLNKNMKSPVSLWHMRYSNKDTIKKIVDLCENPHKVILTIKSDKKSTNVIKLLSKLILRFFGSDKVPLKYITEDEFNKRYSRIPKTTI
jgi:hypothetical protein